MIKSVLDKKNIVLGVSGGIAAYKSVEFLRLLTKAGASVRVIMTENACRFVGPMTFEALSGKPVCTNLFEGGETSFKHIDWSEQAQAVVLAPATANMTAKYAHGIADDALSTFMLAVTCPVMICPSMNTNMYLSPPVQRNLEILRQDGHTVLEPGAGELACGVVGPGRLPEPEQIFDRLLSCLSPKDLSGRKILISAGPTQEPFDPVRFITNPSSGKMGYALARAAENRGANVTLVSGPTNLTPPLNIKTINVRTASDMAEAVFACMDDMDVIIKTAAVADYRPKDVSDHKIKKGGDEKILTLQKNQDILKILGQRKTSQMLVGFAAETRSLKEYAQKKLLKKNLDMIVGNLVNRPGSGFGTDTNQVTIYYREGEAESLPQISKDQIAHLILDRINERLND